MARDIRQISFYGGEPTDAEIFQGLKLAGYAEVDVLGLYLVRQIPQWKRQRKLENAKIEELAPRFIEYCQLFVLEVCVQIYAFWVKNIPLLGTWQFSSTKKLQPVEFTSHLISIHLK